MIISSDKNRCSSIKLQTRKGRDVLNGISYQLSKWDIVQFKDYRTRYPSVDLFNKPSAIYNCHGLTFASRRTRIYNDEEIYKILDDDGYKQIEQCGVSPGDIVVYFDEGEVDHSGLVISKPTKETFNFPLVWSKWGNYYEVIHFANNCPYGRDIKYYRLEPNDNGS